MSHRQINFVARYFTNGNRNTLSKSIANPKTETEINKKQSNFLVNKPILRANWKTRSKNI